MADVQETDFAKTAQDDWQARLEDEFGARIDSALIAALLSEPGQTLEDVRATLRELSSSADGSDDPPSRSPSQSTETTVDAQDIERALDEWKLMEHDSENVDHLQLTDEEGTKEPLEAIEVRESVRLGDAVGDGSLSIEKVASGQDALNGGVVEDNQPLGYATKQEAAGGLDFLVHAFPTRTHTFLREILRDEGGDVLRAIDTLATLEMIERGDFDDDDESHAPSARGKERDDEKRLEFGTHKKKVTKRDRQRRREQEAQAHGITSGGARALSHTLQKVNLTDVRQGGASGRFTSTKTRPAHTKSCLAGGEDIDDAALAQQLAREERIAAGLPADEQEEDDSVQDNDWLFSSSVLEQLSLLLDLPPHKIKSVHAQCHMNLRATFHRLIQSQSEAIPSLSHLDEFSDVPSGTSRQLVDGLSVLLPSLSVQQVERYVCAAKGREDAVLDLAQLADRIEATAVGERTDILDPMKMDRKASAQVFAPASSAQAGPNARQFEFIDSGRASRSPQQAGQTAYASAATRLPSGAGDAITSREYALQRLRQGASSVTFPLNSGASTVPGADSALGARKGTAAPMSALEASRLAQEYAAIAQEYRQRRAEYLSKAANSYRLTHNASTNRGPMRGAAAWVYADEARRLDAKARAFSLQSAQAMVQYRMLANRSSLSAANASTSRRGHDGGQGGAAERERQSGDVVDLHGLTVHEALTIARQTLDSWWAKMGDRSPSSNPLHLITGVGRHSRGNVALIRPAILAMLQRERWSCREPQQGHIVVVGRR